MHLALRQRYINGVSLILKRIEKDSDNEFLLIKNKDGDMAIHFAAVLGNRNVVNLIQKIYSGEEKMENKEGKTAQEILDEKLEEVKAEQKDEEKRKEELIKQREIKRLEADLEQERKAEMRKKKQKLLEQAEKEEKFKMLEEKKKAPYKLLLFVLVFILGVYMVLKIAERNNAGGSGGNHESSNRGIGIDL